MKEFNFYQDQKVSLWNRFFFKVKAENYNKAVEIVKGIQNEDIFCVENDNTIQFSHSKRLDDTEEQLSLKDNNGNPTLELFNEQGEYIADNTNADPNGSYEVVSISLEDLEELGFDTSEVTHTAMEQLVRKMDISDVYWSNLEYTAEKIGLKKLKK